MCDCEPAPAMNLSVNFITSFDICELECEGLMKLFQETTSCIRDIRIERVANGRSHRGQEEHPATTLGITIRRPTIRFADSLDREERIDTIAHELVHVLLVYRYGLRMIDRRISRPGSNQDIFDHYLDLNKYWNYFLGQTVNTVHHRILIDYLKEEYGIESDFHFTLLRHNFRIVSKSHYPDRESQYAKGLIAFEYETRKDKDDRALNPNRQSEFFWKAYYFAQKHFGGYHLHAIPTPSAYEENVLSFLEDLGYQKRDFMFLPETALDFPSAIDSINAY
jgi:hypothetical protein